jgi:hypothetical protein
MDDFIAPTWQATLRDNALDSFEALWALEAGWFEPPNRCRGGWSGVARIELTDADGSPRVLFLKRQEDHLRRSLRHPLRGEPTFAAEFRSLLRLNRCNVPTQQPVFFAQRREGGHQRAILATEELARYRPLDDWIRDWRADGWRRCHRQRRSVIHAAADTVRRLHRQRLVHNALHPKHLFVRFDPDGSAKVRLIDLEKMRPAGTRMRALRRDLDSLNRRTPCFTRSDRLRFLMHYLGVRSLAPAVRHHWRYLSRRFRSKRARIDHDC